MSDTHLKCMGPEGFQILESSELGILHRFHQLNFYNLKIQNQKHLEHYSSVQSLHMCSVLDLKVVGSSA